MDRPRGQGRSGGRAALLTLVVVLCGAATALAAGRPMPGTSFVHAPGTLTRGRAVTLTVRLSGGRHGSASGRLTLAISADKRLDKHDVVLATKSLGALKARATRSVKAKVRPSAKAPLGKRRLLACVAPGKRAAPRCVSHTVKVLAAAAPGGGTPTPTPTPTPGPSPTPTPTPAAPPTGDGHFPSTVPTTLPGVTPHPTTVTAHPDSARAASGVITSDAGGTLSATGADGTTYTLEVPAKAVLSDVTMTMTPLSSVDGLPFASGLAGGVQFAPEGLQLLQPAKLTITPATAPTGTPVAFDYHGTGSDLALVPIAAGTGGSSVVEIMHFSGAGVSGATSSEITAAESHAPSLTPDQFRAKVAADLLDSADTSVIVADADAYFDNVIRPELQAALSDDSLAPGAAADALQLERQLALLGIDFGARGTEIDNDLVQFMVNQYNHAYERCVTNHDPVETRNMTAALRSLTLIGADSKVDQTKMLGCLSFKLDLDLNGEGRTGNAGNPLLDGKLHAHENGIPLEFDTALDRVTGAFPITVDSYSWYDYLCNRTGGTATPGAPGTLQLFIQPNIVEKVDATGRVASFGPPTLELRITPGAMTTTNACGLTGFSGNFYHELWDSSFYDRKLPSDTTVRFGPGDWSFAGGDPWAMADVNDSYAPADTELWTGEVKLTLHHTPHTG